MVHNYVHTEYLPLEERIRRAGGERSVELGYRIGGALVKLGHGIRALFAPRKRAHPIGDHRIAAGD